VRVVSSSDRSTDESVVALRNDAHLSRGGRAHRGLSLAQARASPVTQFWAPWHRAMRQLNCTHVTPQVSSRPHHARWPRRRHRSCRRLKSEMNVASVFMTARPTLARENADAALGLIEKPYLPQRVSWRWQPLLTCSKDVRRPAAHRCSNGSVDLVR